MKIRQGRRNARNIYLQIGDEPSDQDISIGYIREPRWAKAVCEAANAAYGGVVPSAQASFALDADWQRAEELRTERLGPGPSDIPEMKDTDRPSASLRDDS